jgi:coproporphyrinogen III oxidase
MPEINPDKTPSTDLRERWIHYIHALQDTICDALEVADNEGRFKEDRWDRSENGGGGKTRVIENGRLLEKGGVNTSVVYGDVTDAMRAQLKIEGSKWFACGFSHVLHPLTPCVPAVHANWRYFELYDESGDKIDSWFWRRNGSDALLYFPGRCHPFSFGIKEGAGSFRQGTISEI